MHRAVGQTSRGSLMPYGFSPEALYHITESFFFMGNMHIMNVIILISNLFKVII